MIHSGTWAYETYKSVYNPADDDYTDVLVILDVDWEAELTTLGDGRKEWDFQCTATDENGKSYPLSEEDETKIFEQLRNAGEF